MDLLKQLYYDPETGLQSKDKLYRKAKALDKTVTLKIVKEFLDKQPTAQITKQHSVKAKDYDTITSPAVQNNYQMDLMYLPDPSSNKNSKYVLTCIDVFSRFVFVRVLKDKTGKSVFSAFVDIMEHESGFCKNLNLDLGSEFIYTPFVEYCRQRKIKLWFSNPEQDNKNSIIERFHRTLRNMILKYSVSFGKSYIDDIQKLVHNYNYTYHSTIKNRPIDVWMGDASNKQKVNNVVHSFKVNDKVRHLQKKKVFDKRSSTSTFTKSIYTITRIEGNSYYLDELTKPFRNHELVLAVGDNIINDYEKQVIENNTKEANDRRVRRELGKLE